MNNKNLQKGNYTFGVTTGSFNAVLIMLTVLMSSMLCVGKSSSTGVAASENNLVAKKVNSLKEQSVNFKEIKIFNVAPTAGISNEQIAQTVRGYTLLNLSNGINEVLTTKPEYLKVSIPIDGGKNSLTVMLYKVDISPNGFTLLTSDAAAPQLNNTIVHYRGCVENDPNSVASFTFSDNETMALISNHDGNYVLGKLDKNAAGIYIVYNDKNLLVESGLTCGTSQSAPKVKSGETSQAQSAKCVNWYWEIDNDVYVNKGSTANVNSYVQGIFNQVSTLYANDGMSIALKTVYVWTTTDPYTGPATSDFLTQFGNYRTSFDGDLANLIGYKGNGGIAWIDGFCNTPKYEMAYTGISASYNSVPTYSWTVEVVAHEEGHLFGSKHTHACAWNGNNTKIDDCGGSAGYSEGTCPPEPNPQLPVGGGTIMSYCHLTSVGINLSLGFGAQPKAVMQNTSSAAACLSACSGCTAPAEPAAISGNVSICSGSSQTYSVAAVTGATSYTWSLPAGWTGSSTTNSITATGNTSVGAVSVAAKNSCGSSIARTLSISVTSAPALPGSITEAGGIAGVCPGDSRSYSVLAVAGVTYIWTTPAGATIIGGQGTHSVNVDFTNGFTSAGTLSVKASNSCGTSTARTITISRNILAAPGSIKGPSKACTTSSSSYSISAVANAISYIWTVPLGASILSGQGTTGIKVLWKSTGTLSVVAVNTCGNSTSSSMSVAVNAGCREGETQSPLAEASNTIVFPNPSYGNATLQFNSPVDDNYIIKLRDLTGRETVIKKGTANEGLNNVDIDLSDYQKGIYLLHLEAGNANDLIKVILQ